MKLEMLLLSPFPFFHSSPLPCRRTTSVVSDFVPLTPFRSRSAAPRPLTVPCHVMQRHKNVGVARLYDWSTEQDKDEPLSVSRLYREIAGGVRMASVPRNQSPEKARPPRVPPQGGGGAVTGGGSWPGGSSPRVNPGRMFLRDKGMLTKGEREIIQGIYKNRGDIKKYPPNNKSDFSVRSHHDAWLVGKPGLPINNPSTEVPRESPRGSLMEVTAPAPTPAPVPAPVPANHSTETPRLMVTDGTGNGSSDGHQGQARTTCFVCLREQQLLEQLQMQKQQQHKLQKPRQPAALPQSSTPHLVTVNDTFRPRGESVAPAPSPVTPTPTASNKSPSVYHSALTLSPGSKLLPKRQKAVSDGSASTPKNLAVDSLSSGIAHGDTGSESESSQDSDGYRRKLHVKVYLPKVGPEAADDDLRTCMLEGRPAIAREKHLSSTDLREKRGEVEGGELGEEMERVMENETEIERVKENDHVKKKREKAKDRAKRRHPSRTRSSKSSEDAQLSAGDSDSEGGKATGRRVSLNTRPVTILKADSEEDSRQQD
ncbi:hypothetical protein ACOMHN_043209 [Nucella lapillus]